MQMKLLQVAVAAHAHRRGGNNRKTRFPVA
jgi:hypothetical protein